MYKSASAGPQPAAGAPTGDGAKPAEEKPKDKENVVDAEFVDVDDKK